MASVGAPPTDGLDSETTEAIEAVVGEDNASRAVVEHNGGGEAGEGAAPTEAAIGEAESGAAAAAPKPKKKSKRKNKSKDQPLALITSYLRSTGYNEREAAELAAQFASSGGQPTAESNDRRPTINPTVAPPPPQTQALALAQTEGIEQQDSIPEGEEGEDEEEEDGDGGTDDKKDLEEEVDDEDDKEAETYQGGQEPGTSNGSQTPQAGEDVAGEGEVDDADKSKKKKTKKKKKNHDGLSLLSSYLRSTGVDESNAAELAAAFATANHRGVPGASSEGGEEESATSDSRGNPNPSNTVDGRAQAAITHEVIAAMRRKEEAGARRLEAARRSRRGAPGTVDNITPAGEDVEDDEDEEEEEEEEPPRRSSRGRGRARSRGPVDLDQAEVVVATRMGPPPVAPAPTTATPVPLPSPSPNETTTTPETAAASEHVANNNSTPAVVTTTNPETGDVEIGAVGSGEQSPPPDVIAEVAYAETMPSTMKLILRDNKCRLGILALLCFAGAVGVIVALIITGGGTGGSGGDSPPSQGGTAPSPTVQEAVPTVSPTVSSAPTGEILEFIEILSQITSREDLVDLGTPQHDAVVWMASQDAVSENMVVGIENPQFVDRYVMAVLHFATSGATGWLKPEKWLSPDLDVCNGWHSGIECTTIGGISTIIELDLRKVGLKGTLPSEIGSVSGLRNLFLQGNALSGEIPSSLSRLSTIERLELQENAFTGTIPPSIGSLLNLNHLDLSSNNLSGNLPDELYNLVDLRNLLLKNNKLSGTLSHRVKELTLLMEIDLRKNVFTGQIPDELNELADLAFYRFDDNRFGGTLPKFTDFLYRREEVTMANNLISGNLLESFSKLNYASLVGKVFRTKRIDLSGNRLTGMLPPLAGLPSLRYVDLSRNQFTGTLVSSLGWSSNLEYLNFSDCSFNGTVPAFGKAGVTKFVDLRNNRLEGGLPKTLFLDGVELLVVSGNRLGGTIPTEIGQMTKLRDFEASQCSLTGEIPSVLGTLDALSHLDLSNNILGGSLPFELGNLDSLQELYLNNNRIEGEIPTAFADIINLRDLRLNSNSIRNTIPTVLGALRSLEKLELRDNRLTGSVPQEVCELPKLDVLSVDDIVQCSCCTVDSTN